MKKTLVIGFLLLTFNLVSAQEFRWNVDVNPFFDNTEFGKSTVTHDQTMAGTRIAPSVGFYFNPENKNTSHHIMGGIDVLQEFGSKNFIDNYQFIAFYRYVSFQKSYTTEFSMGAFPRKFAVEKYPRAFFQDSISFYRPVMNGITYKIQKKDNYFNLWLDWTGRQSTTQRETFFVGVDGRLQKGVFYAQLYSYLMHYAKMQNPPPGQYIHDNGLMLASLGVDLTKKTKLKKLDINAGWLAGLEDNRGTTDWLLHNGLYIDCTIEYKRFGLKNSFYKGAKQMHFYQTEGNKLYWGDPNYRLNSYNRTDMYIKLFDNENINGKLIYSLHAAEKKLFHEQALVIAVNLFKPYTYKKPEALGNGAY